MNTNARNAILAILSKAQHFGGKNTLDWALYQVRYVAAKDLKNPAMSKLFDSIVEIQDGMKGPVTAAALIFLTNLERDLAWEAANAKPVVKVTEK